MKKILLFVIMTGIIIFVTGFSVSSGPPVNYGYMNVKIPTIWDWNENGTSYVTDDMQQENLWFDLPQTYYNHQIGTIPPISLITNPYSWNNEKYYLEYGIDGIEYCNDHDHRVNLTEEGVRVEVDLNRTVNIWFQVVSQCHTGSFGGKGFWWKADVEHVDPLNPGAVFNELHYKYMTFCQQNGKDYGCGQEDND